MSSATPHHAPIGFDDPADYGRLREVLAAAAFTDAGVAEAVALDEARSISGQDVPLLLHRTGGGSPRETLIRLFLVGVPVDREAAARAAAPMTVEEWIRAGLLAEAQGAVAAELHLLPFRGLVLAFDQTRRLQSDLAAQYVMGIGSSSITLAGLTVRRHADAALDLGTGCGFQAFLAAAHSRRVLATDRNPRAVALARFNAALCGLANVECREGDLFAPAAGWRFDLVVSNPPFVISPESRYIYRDSGLAGDAITQAIVRQVPALLNEGGYCQVLCNWAHLAGQDWRQRLAEWFVGTGCDAWAMPSETLAADAYAAKWIRHTERGAADRFDERFEQWIEHYARQGIEAVSGGLITLRRRSGGQNWYCTDDAPAKLAMPAGGAIERAFAARDFLHALPDEQALLECRLRIAPEVRLHHTLRPGEGSWELGNSELRIEHGLSFVGEGDLYVANLLVHCDGRRPLADLLAEMAAALQRTPAEIAPACLGIVRSLIERGFLLPPS